jgi:hypothetical protein
MLRRREGVVTGSKVSIVGGQLCDNNGRKLGATFVGGKYANGIQRRDDDHRLSGTYSDLEPVALCNLERLY